MLGRLVGAAFAATVMLSTGAMGQYVMMPDSTNNRLVLFDPTNGSVVNSSFFGLAGGTTVHAMQVGNEIWVSEQIGDRVSRWSMTGSLLGQVGGGPTGGLDNIRGMGLIGSKVYVTNAGTGNGAPSANSVVIFDTSGNNLGWFSTAGLAPSPFGILSYQGGMLVSSSSGNDDVHRFDLSGTSQGTFHNSTGLNFAEQMAYDQAGNILVAGFSSNNVVTLNFNTGAIMSTFTASGARGVYQLGNGNILWTNSAGAHIFDVNLGTSSLVYAGGGRYLDFLVIPTPSGLAVLALGGLVGLRRRR